jgi:hypothetical protein
MQTRLPATIRTRTQRARRVVLATRFPAISPPLAYASTFVAQLYALLNFVIKQLQIGHPLKTVMTQGNPFRKCSYFVYFFCSFDQKTRNYKNNMLKIR